MIRSQTKPEFKLAAIDLDGTLLGSGGKMSSANAAAVQCLQQAGVHVVLASGRHYKNMHHYAVALPGVEWLISCQGGELSNVPRTEVLAAEFLPAAVVRETLELGTSLGFSTVAYAVDGVITASVWNSDLEFYTALSGRRPQDYQVQEISDRQIFKLIWMGRPDEIQKAVDRGMVNPGAIQMVRTHARLLEFMPIGVSKASALRTLASRLGITASQSMAFGDGDNDVPMFEWAGLSVAMPHGWPAALSKASHVAPDGPADSALARAVDLVFDRNLVGAAKDRKEPTAVPALTMHNVLQVNPI